MMPSMLFVACLRSPSKSTEWFLNLICNKQKSPSQYGNVRFLRGLYSTVVPKQILPGSASKKMEPPARNWPFQVGFGQSGCVGGEGGTVSPLSVVYLSSHKQRALVSVWLLSLALDSHEKERHLSAPWMGSKANSVPRPQVLMWSDRGRGWSFLE